MSAIGNELYTTGAYIPSLLEIDADLPELESPGQAKVSQKLNVSIIIITAFIFITVISWFNVLSHLYEDTLTKDGPSKYRSTYYSLGYASLVTLVSIVLGFGLYYFSNNF